jgi:acyl-CoA synthetase (AMP-forming)/AMP-acid ligase II
MQITSIIRRAAQINPKGIATIYQDRQQTWTKMLDRVARFAGGLQRLGGWGDDADEYSLGRC